MNGKKCYAACPLLIYCFQAHCLRVSYFKLLAMIINCIVCHFVKQFQKLLSIMLPYVQIVLLIFFSTRFLKVDCANLKQVLRDYEFLDLSLAGKTVHKRWLDSSKNFKESKELIFHAFRRDFRIFLSVKESLLASNFKAYVIDSNGQSMHFGIDPNEFYAGRVFGEKFSMVNAHIDSNGSMTASIWTPAEVYMIEPAWRHIPSSDYSLNIVYRASDIINNGHNARSFCGVDYYSNLEEVEPYFANDSFRTLQKRQALDNWQNVKNRCSLKLVADYHFYREVGGSSTATTVRYLVAKKLANRTSANSRKEQQQKEPLGGDDDINLIDRVNSIYTRTVWRDNESDDGFTDIGFVIKNILVHTSPTKIADHYNSNITKFDVGRLLQAFSYAEGSPDYCLVHLFTAQPFSNGVLGLGYIASPKLGTSGGICSEGTYIQNKLVYFNTALSSARSSYGGPVITREADIVTAHEFGHNWGSPHDPASLECSPVSSAGGPYIMFTYSVSGYDQNNKIFSPCSKRSIKRVLQAKSSICFTEIEHTFCGNQRVEPGEDCDVGLPKDGAGNDRCCSSDCKFKPNAVCSPLNSLCCSSSCQYLPAGEICRKSDLNSCKENSVCNGKSAECPTANATADGTPCLDEGECQNGECVSFCEKKNINMKPCICENETESCFRCCRSKISNECRPFIQKNFDKPKLLKDGTRCIHGYCSNGTCIREVQDLIEHIWNIIDKWDINSFIKFIKNNMVGTVAILTLCIWIPVSIFVNSIDREASLDYEREISWIFSNNLVDSKKRVRIVEGLQHPYLAFSRFN
ncbi:ADAM 17-like protease [Trichinella britovi]|uniref:ADAM 17-like protease n=1 Tax=Trichinella britovi TaxID=45882 RepID=A0A0V1D7P2_TRIBR|nr:ADAM 17-like protease [Trichinella britovi]KRZ86212.1 ADAM 17-like protease [Trichinella sp. T8]